MRGEAPGAVEQVFFGVVGFVEAVQLFAHDAVVGGAGGAHFAGVFDFHAVVQQFFADGFAGGGVKFGAVGREFGVGQDGDFGHRGLGVFVSDGVKRLAGQRFLDARVHAGGGKGFFGIYRKVFKIEFLHRYAAFRYLKYLIRNLLDYSAFHI